MKKILFILFLSLPLLSQPGDIWPKSIQWWHLADGTRDSLWVTFFADTTMARIRDSLSNVVATNGIVYGTNRIITQKIVKDSTTLKAYAPDSLGTSVYMKSLSASNQGGGGLFVYVDSIFPEGYKGAVFGATTAGKQWVLSELKENRSYVNAFWFGCSSLDSTVNGTEANLAITFAEAMRISDVILPGGIIKLDAAIQMKPGIKLWGSGSNSGDTRPSTQLTPLAAYTGVGITGNGQYLHHAGIFNLRVVNFDSTGISLNGAVGENFYMDQVAAYSNGGANDDGIYISGSSTPLHLGHLSVHSNGRAGIYIDGQNSTLVQLLYVAGDNNDSALVYINSGNTNTNVQLLAFKAESWTASYGHYDVIRTHNLNGGVLYIGSGFVHISQTGANKNAIIRQSHSGGSTSGLCKWQSLTRLIGNTTDYNYGYINTSRADTLTTAEVLRSSFTNYPSRSWVSNGSTFFTIGDSTFFGYSESASPTGTYAANKGSMFWRRDNLPFLKMNGANDNTDWLQIFGAKKLSSTTKASAAETGVAHGLGYTPEILSIIPKGADYIWQSKVPDADSVYVKSSTSAIGVDIYVK